MKIDRNSLCIHNLTSCRPFGADMLALVFAGLRGPDLRFPPTKPRVPRQARLVVCFSFLAQLILGEIEKMLLLHYFTLTSDARLEFLWNSGPAPEMREHWARGPVGYQPTIFHPTMHVWRFARSMQMQHCIFNAASLPQENEQTTGLIILHLIRCLQTLRAAALRLMRAKGSGQSNLSIICSICAQRVRCFWV